jgi:GWxTD domain-containing protein
LNLSTGYGAKTSVFALFFCLLLSSTALYADDSLSPWPAFPLESDGEIRFTADGVILLNSDGKEQVFFYISLLEEDLICKAEDGVQDGLMQIDAQLTFLTNRDKQIVQRGTSLEIPCHTAGVNPKEPKRFVYLNSILDHGTSGFEVRVIDRNAKRIGLLYALKSQHKRGFARGWLRPVDRSQTGSLSGMLMLWNIADAADLTPLASYQIGQVEQVREKMEANPLGTYGLYRENVTFYCELYDLLDREVTLNLKVTSLADSTELMNTQRILTIPHSRCAIVKDLSVADLPAGAFEIELTATPVESPGRTLRCANTFQVQWNQDSWRRTERERLDEAAIILDDEDWETYRFLEPGRQESFMAAFWQRHVASDGSAGQLRAKFHARIAKADEMFGGLRRGALTDRGKVYVRFGEPDEIHKELHPQVDDWVYNYLLREIDEVEAQEMGGRPVVHELDQSSYIVWSYLNRGDPLLKHWGDATSGRSLRFIFVDEMAGQEYRLIYSTLFGGF